MPLVVPVDELQHGMRMHEPLIYAGRVMLQGGKVLTHTDIAALRRRFPKLRLRIRDPVLDSVIEFEDDRKDLDVASEVQTRVSACISKVHERFAERASVHHVDIHAIQSTVGHLLSYLKDNPASAALVSSCLDTETYLGAHTGNVFYLSMMLASKVLDYVISEQRRQTHARDLSISTAMDLFPLGLGVMVMDLGMVPLQGLLAARRTLTDEESDALMDHPNGSLASLPDALSPIAKTIVRTHHENCAGTGYPAKLAADRLHVFARIVRIADAFDAATSEHVYSHAKSPARVLWEMTNGPARRFYDPHLTAAFANLVHPFPIGAKLRLKDGRYAAVVKYNRRSPFEPLIVVAFDAQDRPLPRSRLEGPVQLNASGNLRVASFRGEEYAFMYTSLPARDLVPRSRFINPLDAAYP
jgi:HD-GYP domain-containing protein (c-di-GMP phosphodiesterase class II)